MSSRELTKAQAVLELIFAGAIWGFGFVATVWAFESFSASEITTFRFGFSFLLGCALAKSWGGHDVSQQLILRVISFSGCFLGVTLVLQTFGLLWTTPTKSAFITTLYVVLVPLVERFLFGRSLHVLHWVCVLIAVLGMSLLVELRLGRMNYGDFLTLLCALTASGHIIWVGLHARRVNSPFMFNVWQSFFAAVISLAILPFDLKLVPLNEVTPKAWAGLLSLSLGSTLLAFFLQVRAQKILSSPTASMLFLLESPFSLLFSFWLLGERLSASQWTGSGLILLAAALVTLLALSRAQGK